MNGLAPQVEPLAVTGNKLGWKFCANPFTLAGSRKGFAKGCAFPKLFPLLAQFIPLLLNGFENAFS